MVKTSFKCPHCETQIVGNIASMLVVSVDKGSMFRKGTVILSMVCSQCQARTSFANAEF
jgi:transcription elongation factor Elf1